MRHTREILVVVRDAQARDDGGVGVGLELEGQGRIVLGGDDLDGDGDGVDFLARQEERVGGGGDVDEVVFCVNCSKHCTFYSESCRECRK